MNYDSAFYDNIYLEGGSNKIYKKPYEKTPYFPVWEKIITSWIDPLSRVCDLGCGVGQFAHALYDLNPHVVYFGYDFSKVAISKARNRLRNYRYFFLVRDITTAVPMANLMDIFVCLETLEHLPEDKDIELIKRIPKDKTVILSVPNYHADGHYRTFDDIEDIRKRYGALLDIDTHLTFNINDTGGIITAVLAKRKEA